MYELTDFACRNTGPMYDSRVADVGIRPLCTVRRPSRVGIRGRCTILRPLRAGILRSEYHGNVRFCGLHALEQGPAARLQDSRCWNMGPLRESEPYAYWNLGTTNDSAPFACWSTGPVHESAPCVLECGLGARFQHGRYRDAPMRDPPSACNSKCCNGPVPYWRNARTRADRNARMLPRRMTLFNKHLKPRMQP